MSVRRHDPVEIVPLGAGRTAPIPVGRVLQSTDSPREILERGAGLRGLRDVFVARPTLSRQPAGADPGRTDAALANRAADAVRDQSSAAPEEPPA